MRFLEELTPRPWKATSREIEPYGLFIGAGANALEIVVGSAIHQPARSTLLAAWKARRGGRASPVLLVVQHPNGWDLCGATGETPPIFARLDRDRVERLCAEALDQPDRHAALRFLSQAAPSLETALPGIRNEGLLALHELERGVPGREDWAEAGSKAKAAIGKRSNSLPCWKRAVALAGRLAAPDDRFADWAADVGVECGPLQDDEKEDMIHELDAVVAHLYGLTEPQLAHIFETFHEGWNYQARLEGVAKHLRSWSRR